MRSPIPHLGASAGIPSYNLFGESADLPDVIHCETIAARSTLHDWELAPHRHARLHQLLLLGSGGGAVSVDGQRFELAAGSLVNVPTGRVHAFSFRPGTQGWVVTLASETLDEALSQAADVRQVLQHAGVAQSSPALAQVVGLIHAEFEARSYGRAHILRALAATLLGLAARAIETAEAVQRADPGAAHLLRRLEGLIEKHHLQHWGVADYARALAVSPTHLSRVARQATGSPASQLIQDRLVREARRQLLYTNLQVATIAYTLGFADPAHFSRVFQRATGESPRAFRRSLAQRAAGAA